MAENPMLKFVTVDRDMPQKRDATVRREDFNEIYAEYADAKAKSNQRGVANAVCHIVSRIARFTTTFRTAEADG